MEEKADEYFKLLMLDDGSWMTVSLVTTGQLSTLFFSFHILFTTKARTQPTKQFISTHMKSNNLNNNVQTINNE